MTLCQHGVQSGAGYECSACVTTPEPRHDHEFGVYCHAACPRWGNPVPQADWEPSQGWFFTFGANHTHPDTGQRLGRNYVRIYGTCDSTRDDMFKAFGNRWSHQYMSAERAGAEKYGLTEVAMPAVEQHLRSEKR